MKTGKVAQKRPFVIPRYETLVSTKHLSLQRYLPDYTGQINVSVHDGSAKVCSHCSDKKHPERVQFSWYIWLLFISHISIFG